MKFMDFKFKANQSSLKNSYTINESTINTELKTISLKNSNNITVEILNYGGIIKSIIMPDATGKIDDIVLGFDVAEDYLNEHPYFGAIIGRYANRIANGAFSLDGKEYKLIQNHGNNTLHGGIDTFDKKFWDYEIMDSDNTISLVLSLQSPDMDEGFPGKLNVRVLYTLTNENELIIEYEATVDKPTVINMTNHSYFNLHGNTSQTIDDHILQIHANDFTPVNSSQIPTGEIRSVNNSAFDFRTPKKIEKDINNSDEQLKIGNGYDHNYVLHNQGKLELAAIVVEPKSGRKLEVLTKEPGMQFYSGNWLEGISGKNRIQYKKRHGFCLETQHYPDSPNHPEFPSTRLNKGEKFYSKTIYKFSTIQK